MSPVQKVKDIAISHGSTLTFGMLIVIGGGVFAVWTRTVEAAREDATWRAHADEHAAQCERGISILGERCGDIDSRLRNIEMRVHETWPPKANK